MERTKKSCSIYNPTGISVFFVNGKRSQSPDSDQPWNVIDQDELQAKLSSKEIKRKFIVERSP